ncbi:RAD protein [Plasmodium malariae]|uniref:RAD protein n=1 Tax=Plasmodium malariae TaxID=5858 RepID=A0A1A8WYJ4_PLAMA|nr:RAD protein [Plasmodium malariae]SBS97437.1 RAD protein [Plasmodium malariae]SBT87412.1 RAD protein [Plasmodium malariae]
MLAKSCLKRFYLFGFSISCLFVLLNNTICLSKENALTELQLHVWGCPRNLADITQNEESKNGENKVDENNNGENKVDENNNGENKDDENENGENKDDENESEHNEIMNELKTSLSEPTYNLPFGCTNEDISKNLSIEEVKNLAERCSYFPKKSEGYFFYHYYFQNKRTCFLNMLCNIKTLLIKWSQEKHIPNDYFEVLWEECKLYLLECLSEMQNISRWSFFYLMTKFIRTKYHLLEFLDNFDKIWDTVIKKYEEKWTKLLEERVNNYVA